MQTQLNRHSCLAAFATVAIVGVSGVLLDRMLHQSYENALPKGTVEIRQLEPLAPGDFAIVVPPSADETTSLGVAVLVI